MVLARQKSSHSWLFDSHNKSRRSTWLQSTLSDLDEKTNKMLQLVEEDADSFAQRAEMYYKKRPELISMVEDFYRAHRSLAVRFDQVKSESKSRLVTPTGKFNDQLKNPFSTNCHSQKFTAPSEKCYDSYSEISCTDSWESEVDDTEHEEITKHDGETGVEEGGESEVDDPVHEEVATKAKASESEMIKLREELERLQEENKIQKEQLMQKDEEKREVIRQLCSSMEILKDNVTQLSKKSTSKESSKAKNPFEFNKLKGLGKLFGWSSKCQASVVAL